MLDRIIHFSIRNKLIIGLLVLALIGWGTYSLFRLPIDAVPDITDNQVMIITTAPSLAAQEAERLITFPVEQTMASIPGIKHMRSFSRFGLSIVTIVFEEEIDIYWARQQVGERLVQAAANIPAGLGTPEMAPLTTGLGEIYQYVIHPKKGYEQKYTAMDLRTIQDWIIKRQLLGTPGVAEVSAMGGFVKEYEVAVDPDRLRSLDVTVQDIFAALEKNNQNTGGAYIDKKPNAFIIRSEGLVKTFDDLNNIVVKLNGSGMPVLIRDVATVQFGHSVRYGAATRNGKGEVVTGIVMMLKGANSSEVIQNVKEKIEQIKKSLPEGVDIEPFLDRKKLVDNAISTVTKNLIEGALIVIFVLILFLGNLRAGLVVASVIPLSMLFALGMMRVFGVSGNLMSLGAIDFGLIVDGAVIIVEAILHRISVNYISDTNHEKLTSAQMDDQVYHASVEIRSTAAFGEIIILMVYLPLWALVGIEGKMFTPMAQTVSFAILGAFILSLTYVPMMAALGLSRNKHHKKNISDKMMLFFQRIYMPVIAKAIHHRALVILISIGLLILSLITFSRLGGEFIPQLDEGDFAVESRVLTGSSIEQMIDVSAKAQKILLEKFPEVKQVVNKIGSGEIPTDPMPIEAGDMMVILKDKSEWTSASTREALADKMQEELSVIPEATFGFQQPIQMRFNELITGAKQDVVIKIFGEDLDVLADLSGKVGNIVRRVEGAEDVYVEQITGLPQIQVDYNRSKIAQYGLNIDDINKTIKAAFAGQAAGLVYEGEKRFNLVVRLQQESRKDLADVRNLYIAAPSGIQVPLEQLANVEYKSGPNQIQRDDAKRRSMVGFNTRGRDVESIIEEIKNLLAAKLKLPTGYYVTYGGQFENLVEAKERLSIAVPMALLLILLLLFFTFHSVKQSLLIFSAIPFSAIGGIFALWIRGMPFSISAGVGFIALFGVAVLNGIVLIGEFNRLEHQGIHNIYDRVLQGVSIRLRPVLMTAAVASFGFLPMALSNSAGAEVQRPLATVVIGGLLSATLLTLIVLPVLYILFTRIRIAPSTAPAAIFSLLVVSFICLPLMTQAQTPAPAGKGMNLHEIIEKALLNNNVAKMADYEIALQKRLKPGAVNIPKTDISYSQGNISSKLTDNLFNVSQRLEFPSVYTAQSKLSQAKVNSITNLAEVKKNDLVRRVKLAYLDYIYYQSKNKILLKEDSLYKNLANSSKLRYETGESNRLESVTSETQSLLVQNQIRQNNSNQLIALQQIAVLLNTQDTVAIQEEALTEKPFNWQSDSNLTLRSPYLKYLDALVKVNQQDTRVQQHKMLPDILFGYTNQSFSGLQNTTGMEEYFTRRNRFSSFTVGLAIPVFPGGFRSRISASKVNEQIGMTQLLYEKTNTEGELKKLLQNHEKLKSTLAYTRAHTLPQAALITENASLGFKNGELSYIEYLQSLSLAVRINAEYLDNLYLYNQNIIDVEYLLGIK